MLLEENTQTELIQNISNNDIKIDAPNPELKPVEPTEQKFSSVYFQFKFKDEKLHSTTEGKLAMSALLGLNLIKNWAEETRMPSFEVLQSSDSLDKFLEETRAISALHNSIDRIFDFDSPNSAVSVNLPILEQNIENTRTKVKKEDTASPEYIDISIENAEDLINKIKRLDLITHRLGNILTPVSGNMQLLKLLFSRGKYDTVSPVIAERIQSAYLALQDELETLAGKEKEKTYTPQEIVQSFWSYAVPIGKNPKFQDPQLRELGRTDYFYTQTEDVPDATNVKLSQTLMNRLLEDIAQNVTKTYAARELLKGTKAGTPKLLIMNICLSEDGKFLHIRFRDNGLGFKEGLIKSGYRNAASENQGHAEAEIIAKGHNPIESKKIGMKENAADLEDNYGGKIVLNNYEDTFVIGQDEEGKDMVIPISGAEQIFMLPIIQE